MNIINIVVGIDHADSAPMSHNLINRQCIRQSADDSTIAFAVFGITVNTL